MPLTTKQEFKPAHRTCEEMPALLVKAASSPVCVGVRPTVLAAAVLAVSFPPLL
jgi:hypothetical protein